MMWNLLMLDFLKVALVHMPSLLPNIPRRADIKKKILSDGSSLQQICARSGWCMELTGGYEGELVKMVTWDVINSLDKVALDVAAHPVGLEDTKQALIQNLDLSSANDVIRLGILGIGGIGKTTLAKAVYNEVHRGFDGSSSVFNVRSTAEKASGLMELEGRVLKDLVKYGGEVRSVDEGKALMRDRLGGVRALLILDDVDSIAQLQALLGGWMTQGTRVLVTSRDGHILNLAQISPQFIYEMSGLKENKALELFSWHAFLTSSPNQQYEDISRKIVKACQGHPLSLEVVGAFLYDKKNEKDIECWNETLLNIGGWEEIFKTLHISYSALSPEEKEIFLDTACFFKGEKITDHHIVFWKSLGYKKVSSAINNLSMKLLLKIDNKGVFDMHDHLQDMGREIVKRGNSRDPRVWETEDACNLFNTDLRNQYMNVSRLSLQGGYLQHIDVWNTPMLRLLHMTDTKLKHWTVKLNPNLIWLRLRLNFSPLEEEEVLSKWNSLFSPKRGPRFSFGGHDWQLRIMDLSGCTELQRLPTTIGNLSKLQFLTLHGCEKLKNLPDSLRKLSQLQSLDISRCFKLKDLPRNIGHLRQLQSLNMSFCSGLKVLPTTFRNLSQLNYLNMLSCTGLKGLPTTFGNLSQLNSLKMSSCTGLKGLPTTFGSLSQQNSEDALLYWLGEQGRFFEDALLYWLGEQGALPYFR